MRVEGLEFWHLGFGLVLPKGQFQGAAAKRWPGSRNVGILWFSC